MPVNILLGAVFLTPRMPSSANYKAKSTNTKDRPRDEDYTIRVHYEIARPKHIYLAYSVRILTAKCGFRIPIILSQDNLERGNPLETDTDLLQRRLQDSKQSV